MSEITLKSLLEEIHFEIEKRNGKADDNSIPTSIDFFPYLGKKYRLDEKKIPDLIGILTNSHKIFNFDIVKEDKAGNVECEYGFVVAEISIVNSLAKKFEKEVVRVYFEELEKHLSPQKIIDELKYSIDSYNNTTLGRLGNIVLKLSEYGEILKSDYSYAREARQYSTEWKENRFEKELKGAGEIDFYLKLEEKPEQEERKRSPEKQVKKKRRQVDKVSNADSVVNNMKSSMEKNLAVYGIEFYTRVCFREYKFPLMIKIVEDGLIKNRGEMQVLSKMIRSLRSHADKDSELHRHANDINKLEKLVNEKLK
jgi:hypothetical protein